MADWKRKPEFKLLAAALVLVSQSWLLPSMAASEVGSISGVVKTDQGRSTLAGAIVHIAQRGGDTIVSSQPSAADGSFRIADLPFGEYEIGVESNGGLFIVSMPLTVSAGATDNVELVVTRSENAQTLVGAGRKAGTAGVWSNPLTAALIVVGAAIVVGAIVSATDDDDDETGASPPALN